MISARPKVSSRLRIGGRRRDVDGGAVVRVGHGHVGATCGDDLDETSLGVDGLPHRGGLDLRRSLRRQLGADHLLGRLPELVRGQLGLVGGLVTVDRDHGRLDPVEVAQQRRRVGGLLHDAEQRGHHLAHHVVALGVDLDELLAARHLGDALAARGLDD